MTQSSSEAFLSASLLDFRATVAWPVSVTTRFTPVVDKQAQNWYATNNHYKASRRTAYHSNQPASKGFKIALVCIVLAGLVQR